METHEKIQTCDTPVLPVCDELILRMFVLEAERAGRHAQTPLLQGDIYSGSLNPVSVINVEVDNCRYAEDDVC